jgi:hypothetical protein
VNVFLVPYTWHRHLAMAFWCAGFGLLAWWGALTWTVTVGIPKDPAWDGPLLLAAVASAVAGASVFGEGNLRRQRVWVRVLRTLLAAALTAAFTLLWYFLWHFVSDGILFTSTPEDAGDSSLVSLRYRIGAFFFAGISTALGPLAARKLEGLFVHLFAGAASGLAAGAVWYLFGTIEDDLYLAGAAMGLAWGFSYGLLAWPIPDALYAGWLRVLTPVRYGRRIPVDAPDGKPKERFVGHFPRGLDLFLPVEDGVMELHLSVAVDDKQRYKARGITLAGVRVKRFLERVDLRYDAKRPAPLETELQSGDRIELGAKTAGTPAPHTGNEFSELEFLMLPREEK